MKLSRRFILAALLLVLTAGSAWAGAQNFKLYNYSGKTIVAVYIMPSWQPYYKESDKFTGGGLPLRHGESTNINFTNNSDDQFWDMRVEYSNGTHESWNELDLFRIYNISIDRKGTIHWNF
ncbi:MAG: hypothetical protein IJP48_11070 [Synergistaceae bacterium]|nr:hypothetical protein [Synergistaceae bacterium]